MERIMSVFSKFLSRFLLVFALNLTSIYAQNIPFAHQKEKLLSELKNHPDEIKKSKILNELANLYLNNAPDSAFTFARQAQKIALKYDQKDELAMSYLISGNVFYNQGVFNRAIEDFLEALKFFTQTKNQKGQAEIYQDLGLAYHYSKKPEVALENYEKSLQLFETIQDEKGVAGTLSYIGHIFEKKFEYQKALDYQQKALKIYEKLADKAGLAKVMDDIGSIYEDWKDYEKAFFYFSKALETNLAINNQVAAIIDLNNLGDIYQKQGKYPQSLEFAFKSLQLARKLNQKYQLRSAYRDISQTYFLLKDYQKAYTYLDSSYIAYGEVYNSETAQQIAQMQVIYETQEKDKEIALLENSKKFNRLLNYIFLGGIILLMLLGLVIFNRQRLLILKNKKIIEQNQRIYAAENELQNAALKNMQLNELQLKIELENKQLREAKLQDELEMRSRELTGRTLLIIQKNEILVELLEKIELVIRKKEGDKDRELKKLVHLIEQSTQLDKDWNEFARAFEQVHGVFFTKLQNKFPDLTAGEMRLCALLRLNMNSKDLATTLGISQDSLRVNRHRLRKKLNLSHDENLTSFMMSI
jgi:tetratricopeptide (TPR) repeat protein